MPRNKFVAPRKLSDGSTGDLRTHCKRFEMTAIDENDMKFLSHLYQAIWLDGGVITIDTGQGKKIYNFGK